MLALLGFLMVATFMTLIMTKRLPPLVALIVIPTLFGLAAGHGAGLAPMMLEGVRQVAPTAVMLMFAILYFGLMIDAGLFDPLVRALLNAMRGDPVRVVMGTVVLAAMVSLDGDGSTTYMVTVAALLPLYRRLGLNPLIMACLIMLASGVLNLTPWGGPTARAAAALRLDVDEVFIPLLPAMGVTLAWLAALAYRYGRLERARLGRLSLDPPAAREICDEQITVSTEPLARRPGMFWINLGLTTALLALLITGAAPLPPLFMGGFAIAALVNYRDAGALRARIAAHAPNVLAVVSLVFAAGAFAGILTGAGMVEAMSRSIIGLIPESMGPFMASITALISLPMTFFVSNDAFYFGVVPILAETASHYGVPPEAIARASLIGQPVHLLSPLVASTYLLVNLSGVEFGDHQKFTMPWAVATCGVLFMAAALTGALPIRL